LASKFELSGLAAPPARAARPARWAVALPDRQKAEGRGKRLTAKTVFSTICARFYKAGFLRQKNPSISRKKNSFGILVKK
jgi:hypothetical protein